MEQKISDMRYMARGQNVCRLLLSRGQETHFGYTITVVALFACQERNNYN